MADDTEPTSGKKHRVIHWNPDAGKESAKSNWTATRILKWSAGGFFALLIAAGIVIRGAKLVFGPNVFGTQVVAAGGPSAKDDPNAAFVSQAKAESAAKLASDNLKLAKKTPQNHPSQLNMLVEIEKDFNSAQATLDQNDFSGALAEFQSVNKRIEEFMATIKAKNEAQTELATLSVQLKDREIARDIAGDLLESATTAASTGKRLLDMGSFLESKHTLDAGLADLKKIDDKLAEYLANNLRAGQLAVTKGAKDDAKTAFNAVLLKSPGNEAALAGLKRAEVADRVHALLLEAQDREKQTKYAEAVEFYKNAFELDPMSAAAQEGQSRAAKLERDTRFDTAFNAAKAAFSRRDWATVDVEANAALKVYATRTDVRDMIRSAHDEARKDAIKSGIEKGYAYEKQYMWSQAQSAFDQVMQIDKENAEAKEQYLYTADIIRKLQAFEVNLKKAEELAVDGEFQLAINFFNAALENKPSYLNPERLTVLSATLKLQNQRVPVTVTSDGDTFVSISGNVLNPTKISKPMTFNILPGNYEIKASKRGFKDKILKLQVKNGGTFPTNLTIVCDQRAA